MDNIKIGIIVQARMGSTRYPEKVLTPIAGRPMIFYLLERMKMVKKADSLILATSTSKNDDKLADYCHSIDIQCFRGSEKDVLKRFYDCSVKYSLDKIIRVTGDNPLTCPNQVDSLIDFHLKNNLQVSSHQGLPLGIGVGIIDFDCLKDCYKYSDKFYQREHVTPYLYEIENRDNYKIDYLHIKGKLNRPEIRLTVDTDKDIKLMDIIFKRLYHNNGISLEEVIDLLDQEPKLLEINKFVHQKGMRE